MESKYIKSLAEKQFKTNLKQKSRKQERVYERMVYYALCREFADESGAEQAKTIGQDHSTRLHALRNWDNTNDQKFLKDYKKAYLELREHINQFHIKKHPDYIKTPREIEDEYRIKLIKIIEKNHSVIDKLKRKSKLYEQDPVFQELFDLPSHELQEFKQLAKVFLKRKKHELKHV